MILVIIYKDTLLTKKNKHIHDNVTIRVAHSDISVIYFCEIFSTNKLSPLPSLSHSLTTE